MDCPGTAIRLSLNQTVSISDTTAGASDEIRKTRNGGPGNCYGDYWYGRDLTYAVTPDVDGTLTVSLAPSYEYVLLRIRTGCPATANEELACQYANNSSTVEVNGLAVKANTTYYVVADGYFSSEGEFSMKIMLLP